MFLSDEIDFCVLSCQWTIVTHHKLTIKKFCHVSSYSMSIAFHHKINYKKLFESMLVGNSYTRHFESMLGGSYLREY